MLPLRTVDSILQTLPPVSSKRLSAPRYVEGLPYGVALAVESMKDHTTDEGWQIILGLEEAKYTLCGHNLPGDETDVRRIVEDLEPGIVVVQDKREWDLRSRKDFRDPDAAFQNVEILAEHPEIFKLTILKDAHQDPGYHRQSAAEIGCHAWIVYYHPRIVSKLAPYTRPEHLIRVYHTLDSELVPGYSPNNRNGCLLSGALSGAYPLRKRAATHAKELPEVDFLPHPGYHRKGCATPGFLKTLSRYKAAICTSSIYGYALRKIMEATACGCVVITDLPTDEVLPEIDENLIRVSPDITVKDLATLLKDVYALYDPGRQQHFAERTQRFYDYRVAGRRLVNDIEQLRHQWLQLT